MLMLLFRAGLMLMLLFRAGLMLMLLFQELSTRVTSCKAITA